MRIRARCDWRRECRTAPICEDCGRCGLHCTCPGPSPAAVAAGRRFDAERAEEVRLETRREIYRYQQRWQNTKRRLDRALEAGDMEWVRVIREAMNVSITRSHPRPKA